METSPVQLLLTRLDLPSLILTYSGGDASRHPSNPTPTDKSSCSRDLKRPDREKACSLPAGLAGLAGLFCLRVESVDSRDPDPETQMISTHSF